MTHLTLRCILAHFLRWHGPDALYATALCKYLTDPSLCKDRTDPFLYKDLTDPSLFKDRTDPSLYKDLMDVSSNALSRDLTH